MKRIANLNRRSQHGCVNSVAPSHYITMSIYLVKLLKRLLDFKSFLLFLIKCTAEQTPAA